MILGFGYIVPHLGHDVKAADHANWDLQVGKKNILKSTSWAGLHLWTTLSCKGMGRPKELGQKCSGWAHPPLFVKYIGGLGWGLGIPYAGKLHTEASPSILICMWSGCGIVYSPPCYQLVPSTTKGASVHRPVPLALPKLHVSSQMEGLHPLALVWSLDAISSLLPVPTTGRIWLKFLPQNTNNTT